MPATSAVGKRLQHLPIALEALFSKEDSPRRADHGISDHVQPLYRAVNIKLIRGALPAWGIRSNAVSRQVGDVLGCAAAKGLRELKHVQPLWTAKSTSSSSVTLNRAAPANWFVFKVAVALHWPYEKDRVFAWSGADSLDMWCAWCDALDTPIAGRKRSRTNGWHGLTSKD